MNLYVATKFFEYLVQNHKGRQKAESRTAILDRLKAWCININDRSYREIYSSLPICSSNDGLYIPVTPEDVEAFKRYALKTRPPAEVEMKVRRIYATWPHLAEKPNAVQLKLDMDAAKSPEARP